MIDEERVEVLGDLLKWVRQHRRDFDQVLAAAAEAYLQTQGAAGYAERN